MLPMLPMLPKMDFVSNGHEPTSARYLVPTIYLHQVSLLLKVAAKTVKSQMLRGARALSVRQSYATWPNWLPDWMRTDWLGTESELNWTELNWTELTAIGRTDCLLAELTALNTLNIFSFYISYWTQLNLLGQCFWAELTTIPAKIGFFAKWLNSQLSVKGVLG